MSPSEGVTLWRQFAIKPGVTAWFYVTNVTHTHTHMLYTHTHTHTHTRSRRGICARVGVTGVDWASWVTAEDSPLLRSAQNRPLMQTGRSLGEAHAVIHEWKHACCRAGSRRGFM